MLIVKSIARTNEKTNERKAQEELAATNCIYSDLPWGGLDRLCRSDELDDLAFCPRGESGPPKFERCTYRPQRHDNRQAKGTAHRKVWILFSGSLERY